MFKFQSQSAHRAAAAFQFTMPCSCQCSREKTVARSTQIFISSTFESFRSTSPSQPSLKASLKRYQSLWNTPKMSSHTTEEISISLHPLEPPSDQSIVPPQILASASYGDTIKLYIEDPSDDWYCFSTLTGHTLRLVSSRQLSRVHRQ